jgi:F-type H+-transporting ATPase subunit gamma
MKMVSAAKLKKAQDAIVMLRPYSEKLQIIQNVNSSSDPDQVSVCSERRLKSTFHAVTSNRGLQELLTSS